MAEAKFKVISDSCLDMIRPWVEELDVDIVPLYVGFEGEEYKRDYYDFTYRELYQRMVDEPENYPKTSLPSVDDYISYWEPYVKQGIPVLSISMTSGMSGSYNSARNAVEVLKDRYPDARVEAVDSLGITIFQGFMVREACKLRDRGLEVEEAAEIVRDMHNHGTAFFIDQDLTYLIKGGRIGKLLKVAIGKLRLQPVVLFDEGNIYPGPVSRSYEKSFQEVAKRAVEYFTTRGENPMDYYLDVGHSYDIEMGEKLRIAIRDRFKEVGIDLMPGLQEVGSMCAVHNGPSILGVALLKKM